MCTHLCSSKLEGCSALKECLLHPVVTGQVIKQLEKDGLITRPDYSGLYAPSLLA